MQEQQQQQGNIFSLDIETIATPMQEEQDEEEEKNWSSKIRRKLVGRHVEYTARKVYSQAYSRRSIADMDDQEKEENKADQDVTSIFYCFLPKLYLLIMQRADFDFDATQLQGRSIRQKFHQSPTPVYQTRELRLGMSNCNAK